MVRGAEHSAPLKVKYQRLHAFFPWVLRVPIQYTWRAVSEKFLVNTHSCAKNKNNNNNYNYNNKKNRARTRLIIRCFPALSTSKRKNVEQELRSHIAIVTIIPWIVIWACLLLTLSSLPIALKRRICSIKNAPFTCWSVPFSQNPLCWISQFRENLDVVHS